MCLWNEQDVNKISLFGANSAQWSGWSFIFKQSAEENKQLLPEGNTDVVSAQAPEHRA